MQRLIASIQRVIDADAAGVIATRDKASLPDIEIDAVFELGVVLAARTLWENLGIGAAIRSGIAEGELSAPHSMEFKDLSKLDLVGMYPNYAEALKAWRGKAQSTVDNAQMRYFVVHIHRLMEPDIEH